MHQLSQYATSPAAAVNTGEPVPADSQAGAPAGFAVGGEDEAQKPLHDVTPSPELSSDGSKIISREEKIEYRDQDGNLLDEEQVAALEM